MKRLLFILALLILLSMEKNPLPSLPDLSARVMDETRLCLLPMVEAEGVLSRWLIDSGFEVFRNSLGIGQVQLSAFKGKEKWEILLKTHSPLASHILAKYTLQEQFDQTKVEVLWAYLDDYLRGPLPTRVGGMPDQEVPALVLSQRKSVVCVKARAEGDPIQFSGFIIDREGFILSTAHDLKDVRTITIFQQGGEELQGDLIHLDPVRDLSLIQVPFHFNSSVRFAEGKNRIKIGEKIYLIGCPLNQPKAIASGTIDGPLRQVSHLPLWQMKMEILPGNSGSPVFNGAGDLIGVVKGRYRGTDEVGFMIPLDTITEFLKKR